MVPLPLAIQGSIRLIGLVSRSFSGNLFSGREHGRETTMVKKYTLTEINTGKTLHTYDKEDAEQLCIHNKLVGSDVVITVTKEEEKGMGNSDAKNHGK